MRTRELVSQIVLSCALAAAGVATAQADPLPRWGDRIDLVGLVDGTGRLLARDGSVLTDKSGEPLRPACALSAVTPELFRFFVQPGRSDRLLIYHDGGGACWESNTCVSPLVSSDPTYDPRITEDEYKLAYAGGILDRANQANPFKDWTKVFIPYCTGDVGWGNRDVVYQTVLGALPVRHRGYANVRAVLRWLEDHYRGNNLPAPAKVALTGSSAGAYATIGTVFPEAIKLLPSTTNTYVIADSGNGVVTDSFLASAKANWGFQATLPEYLIPVVNGGAAGLPVRFFSELTKRFRGTRFGQFQNAYDSIQTVVLNTMKYTDDPQRWTDRRDLAESLIEWSLSARLATNLSAIAPNYRFYTGAGTEHVVLVNIPVEANAGFCSDNFYTESSAAGLSFRNWTNDMVNGGGYFWNTGNWRNATCFPNCIVPPTPGCLPLVQP
jgi:Pectinacetylesterase